MPDILALILVCIAVLLPLALMAGIFHRAHRTDRIISRIRLRKQQEDSTEELIVRRILRERSVPESELSIREGTAALRQIAEELGVDANLLRPEDRFDELFIAIVPFLANSSIDALETRLWSLERDANCNGNDSPSAPLNTIGEFVARCAWLSASSPRDAHSAPPSM